MTIVAATRCDRGRNFLQPGVVLKCPLGHLGNRDSSKVACAAEKIILFGPRMKI